MSLKAFHIVFIAVCFLLGAFLIYLYQSNPSPFLLVTGIGLLILLLPYTFWFLKRMKTLSTFLLFTAYSLYSSFLNACPVCYAEKSADVISQQTINATKAGIVFLGGVILFVLTFIAYTGFSWAKKAKEIIS